MYIEDKLFSETSGERYYSVIMTEEEYGLYSEFQKEFGKVKEANKVLKKAWELDRATKTFPAAGNISAIRKHNRSVRTTPFNVNDSIELKRVTMSPATTVSDVKRSSLFDGQDLKKYKKDKTLLSKYDHGKDPTNIEGRISHMKDIMKKTKYNKEHDIFGFRHLYSDQASALSEKTFNSKAAKKRNNAFFQNEGNAYLKKIASSAEPMTEKDLITGIEAKQKSIDRSVLLSKANKLRNKAYKAESTGEIRQLRNLSDKIQNSAFHDPEKGFKLAGTKRVTMTPEMVQKSLGRESVKKIAEKPSLNSRFIAKKLLRKLK